MENKRRFRQELYITNIDESFEWYLIIIEVNEFEVPLDSFIVKIPVQDKRFRIYPYLSN